MVEELASKQAITEILYLYARGWDRLDEAAIRACFHDDATHRHGGFEGASSNFITTGLAMCAPVRSLSHLITNPIIVVAGEIAISECSFLAHHRRPAPAGGDEDMFLKGRYLDRFERRAATWKIARREAYHDFERIVAPADLSLAAAPRDQLSGFWPDDPLYAMLASIVR